MLGSCLLGLKSKMAQKLISFGQKIATKGPALATKYSFQAVATAKKSQPTLEKIWSNVKVEMRPPSTSDWPAIKKAFGNLKEATMTGQFLNVTVKEGVTNTLVAVEIAMWFYVGEIVGRRSIIGYNV